MADQPTPIDWLLTANRRYAAERHNPATPAPPQKGLVIVTCMDARIVAPDALGLASGDAHILRNAGGRVSDDVLRSLAVSCGAYGTSDVAVIHHTDCGMLQPPEELAAKVASATGRDPVGIDFQVIAEPEEALRTDVERVRRSSLVPDEVRVWGLRYDVTAGQLTLEVPAVT